MTVANKRDATVAHCKNEDCDYKMAFDNTNLTSETTANEAVKAQCRRK